MDDRDWLAQRFEAHRAHLTAVAYRILGSSAEAAAAGLGKPASRFASAAERVQEVLGEYHDSAVAQAELRRMGVQAHLDGENGFTFGRLHALEQVRGEQAEANFERAWQRLARKKRRRWLSRSGSAAPS